MDFRGMSKSSVRKKRGVDALVNGVCFKGADYIKDMEGSSQRRKVVRIGDEDRRVDKGYVSFLADLEEYWDKMNGEGEDEEDQMYAIFLQRLKKHGNAYMLDVSKEHGVIIPIVYEAETRPFNKVKKRTQGTQRKRKTRRTHQDDHLAKSSQKKSRFVHKVSVHPPDVVSGRTAGSLRGTSVLKKEILDVKMELEDLPALSTPPSAAFITTPEKKLVSEGEDFEEVEVVQPLSREELLKSLREELHETLRKPYDQKEHENLWQNMSSRSQVRIFRDSRSGGTYKPGRMGQSHLDIYSGVKQEIEKAKSDPHKVLNLLRMLSFYLKNVPAGIPVPWLDAYTMSILPGSASS